MLIYILCSLIIKLKNTQFFLTFMIITFGEIIDLILMIAVTGFIFMDSFVAPQVTRDYDPLKQVKQRFNKSNYIFAIAITAPAIVLHEAMHKIVGLIFGLPSVFHAAYTWLGIGLVAKLLNFPFLFIVPGFVSYPAGIATPLETFFVALAGPATNFAIYGIAALALKQGWGGSKYVYHLALTKKLNLYLGLFNMIPFGGFDGATVVSSFLAII